VFDEGWPFGTSVQTTTFDDEGSGTEPKAWTSKYGYSGGESFEEFLVKEADLPPEEAADLGAKVFGPWLEEWRRTGGEESIRGFNRFYLVLAGGVLVVLGLAFLGLALVVWRLTDWIG
jgi:hypothetical protein